MMWLLILLAGMWSLGCIVAAFWAVMSSYNTNEKGLALLIFLIGVPVAALMAVLPWGIWAYEQSPDLATLKKGEWSCTVSHVETILVPISTGKTTTMVPEVHSVCDRYDRIR